MKDTRTKTIGNIARITGYVIGIPVMAVAVFLIVFPLLAHQRSRDRTGALVHYQQIARREKVGGQYPFIYVSWLAGGRVNLGRTYTAYDNGQERRLFFRDWEVAGTSGITQDRIALQRLQHLPLLPRGLATPHAASHGKLLLVSQRRGREWHTHYYDRENLPPSAREVVRLLHIQ